MHNPTYDVGQAGDQPVVYYVPTPYWARVARFAVRYAIAVCAIYGVLSMAGVV